MSEPDKYDQDAAEMLPCCWVELGADEADQQEPCPVDDPGCAACVKRPTVAARLRAVGKQLVKSVEERASYEQKYMECLDEIAQLKAFVGDELARSDYRTAGDMRAEIERLKTALGQANADLMGCRDGALIRDLRAEIERLRVALNKYNEMANDWAGRAIRAEEKLEVELDAISQLRAAMGQAGKGEG